MKIKMNLQVKIHVSQDLEVSKEVVERLVSENTSTKLDHYLAKFSKNDAEGMLEVKIDKNKKGLFDGVIHAKLDGNAYRSEREDFKNLDDLINHLFEHLKEQLSNKK
nr:hypothetical protein [Candidatus Gracilibacteria bacterium]